MDAAVLGDSVGGGSTKAFPRARQRRFAVPALRELEVLAGLSFCEMRSQYPQSAFQGFSRGRWGQQQFATQTLHVHLLGID